MDPMYDDRTTDEIEAEIKLHEDSIQQHAELSAILEIRRKGLAALRGVLDEYPDVLSWFADENQEVLDGDYGYEETGSELYDK